MSGRVLSGLSSGRLVSCQNCSGLRTPFVGSRRRAFGFSYASAQKNNICVLYCHWNRSSSLQNQFPSYPCQTSKRYSNQRTSDEEKEHKPILSKTSNIRRELSARVSQNLTHENIYNLPNFLTFSRLLAGPAIGYLILHNSHVWAVALFFYAGLTDLVDGWIARRWKLQTVVGSIVDPLADKTLMVILTICLATQGHLPIWLATLILGRDVSLGVAAIYYRYASLPDPKTLARYWDFSLPSAEVHPTGISKANTFLQLLLIGATTAMPLAGPSVSASLESLGHVSINADSLMMAAQYIIATTTVWSGASYLYTRKAVKILGEKDEQSKKKILVKGRMILGSCFASCAGLALILENL